MEIVKIIDYKEYIKGDIVFIEGNVVNMFYFINEGKIKLYKYIKDGKE